MDQSIDIVIPIYNAYDDLRICLDSVYKYTDLHKNRLILINDNSSDQRIKHYLKSQQKENVIVFHNEQNKGFSSNINLGMEQSKERDVILLNSDTVVTPKWVEKMVKCAYSDNSIGTVTPLSNNATLCSVPNFCQENILLEDMTIEQAAAIVEECSLEKYPRITVANGFCMLVKREVINIIGKFDAETFGRGYGEENDFCNRAEQMGYIHVMCDNTFIYHSGTKSFISKEKEVYIKEHEQILYKRYPLQMQKNAEHCRDNPNGWVGENIGMHFDLWNGRKNVLYLLQSDFREDAKDNVGGTQLHVKHLTYGLRNTMNIFVAARSGEYLWVTAYAKKKEYSFRFYIGEKELFPLLHSRELAEIFRTILEGFKIDLVHVHHTITTSLDIYYEADRLGIPVIFTMHDYYYVCPTIKMLDHNQDVCIYKEKNSCIQCLNNKLCMYQSSHYLSFWRKKHEEILDMCCKIIVPSKSAKDIFTKFYQKYEHKIQIIEHGMDRQPALTVDEKQIIYTDKLEWKIEKIDRKKRCPLISGRAYLSSNKDGYGKIILKVTDRTGKQVYLPTTYGKNSEVLDYRGRFYAYIPNDLFLDGDLEIRLLLYKSNRFYMNKNRKEIIKKLEYRTDAKLRVAFIGGLNEEKGGRIAYDIIKKGSSEIEWYVLGGIGEENLYQLRQDNLIKTGFYYQEDLSTWLQYYKIDVVCILSKWPETFSYTLSEAVLSKIPVIVTNIGALGQRTKEYGYGEIVPIEEAVEMTIEKLDEYINDKKALYFIDRSGHKTICEMLDDYSDIYNDISKMNRRSKMDVNVQIFNAWIQLGHLNESSKEMEIKIRNLQRYISKIETSAAFIVMRKVYNMKVPFKKQIREFILKRR